MFLMFLMFLIEAQLDGSGPGRVECYCQASVGMDPPLKRIRALREENG